ncbi:MAG: hypothetical protein Fur0010_00390 [Bdellovibrio sp.]
MTQFDLSTFELMKKGLDLFNREMFWECHEELEHHWLELRGDPMRNVLWAVIQVATVNFHVRNENIEGAKGMLKKSLEKIDRIEKDFVESELMEKMLSWKKLKKILREIPKNSVISDFQELYHFKFPIN